jgi:hypothetical protein
VVGQEAQLRDRMIVSAPLEPRHEVQFVRALVRKLVYLVQAYPEAHILNR